MPIKPTVTTFPRAGKACPGPERWVTQIEPGRGQGLSHSKSYEDDRVFDAHCRVGEESWGVE